MSGVRARYRATAIGAAVMAASCAGIFAMTAPAAGALPATPAPVLYVMNQGSGTVTPVDTATNTAGPPITVGNGPRALVLKP